MIDWWLLLLFLIGGMIFLVLLRIPVAYSLLAISCSSTVYFFGPKAAVNSIVLGAANSVSSFVLVAVPLFILLGEILLASGASDRALAVVDRILGRIRGRQPILAILSGGLLGIMSGSTLANTAVLGRSLVPRMIQQGYSRQISTGSVLASGGLAMVIPPSTVAIIWGATAEVPVGKLLIAGLLPGLLMMISYLVVIRICTSHSDDLYSNYPDAHGVAENSYTQLIVNITIDLAPICAIVFLVLGMIILGIATPSEAAALGALGAIIIGLCYRSGDLQIVTKAMLKTAKVTSGLFLILLASSAYSQVLSFSGASRGLAEWVISLSITPIAILLLMQVTVVFLGLFLEQISIILLTAPLFMPIVHEFGWDPIWFGIIMLVNLQMAGITPPFGLNLFVMKNVAPSSITIMDIYKGAALFIGADVVTILILIAFPAITLWLPQVLTL